MTSKLSTIPNSNSDSQNLSLHSKKKFAFADVKIQASTSKQTQNNEFSNYQQLYMYIHLTTTTHCVKACPYLNWIEMNCLQTELIYPHPNHIQCALIALIVSTLPKQGSDFAPIRAGRYWLI